MASQSELSVRKTWAFVAVLTGATVISFVHRYLPAVLVDAIRRDVAISDLEFSTLQSAFAFTYAGAILLSGWFSDRGSRRNIIVGGVATWTIGTIVFGLAPGLPQMLVGRVMVGLGEAVLVPAGISLLWDMVSPERRGRAIALTYFGATLGTSLSFSGGGWLLGYAEGGGLTSIPLIGELMDWRRVVLLLAVVGVILIPLLLAFREPARASEGQATASARFKDLWQLRGKLWLVLFTGSSIAVADFAYTTWQTALLTRSYGWDVSDAGQALGLTALVSGTIAAWIGGWLVDRLQARQGIIGGIALLRVCGAGLVLAASMLMIPSGAGGVAAYAAWQGVANVAYVAVAVSLQALVTDRTRALAASMQVCLSIGVGLGFGPSSVAALNGAIGGGENALPLSLLVFVGILGGATIILAHLLFCRIRGELSKTEKLA